VSSGLGDGPPGRLQRLIARIAPGLAKTLERSSREWHLICERCGHDRTYWDIGGIRWGARSVGKRMRLPCPACGRTEWHAVDHRPDPGSAPG
jgi:ribosomal protein L37E